MANPPPGDVAMSISNSSDAAEVAGDASVRASVGAPSALAEAQRKLAEGGFDLGDLPQARDDAIWGEIRTEHNLSLQELSALKNHACPVQPRGVLPRISGELYRIHDERIRAEFTITNQISPTHAYTMDAELLVDSGAQTELKLPTRKVLQLGLRPLGAPRMIRGATNHTSMQMNFFPVVVKAVFDRDGVQETVENALAVRCDKKEYDDLVAAGAAPQVAPTVNQPQVLSPVQQQSNTSAATAPSTPTGSLPITEIRLSPARHRPLDRPEETAVIGIEGLKKLRLHLNCERQQLEIEEEEILEEGEEALGPDEW